MSTGTLQLYYQARIFYSDPDVWTLRKLSSKRLRMVIRLIALEEVCQERGIGAMPPQTVAILRLLSDFKEANRKRYYQPKNTRPDLAKATRTRKPQRKTDGNDNGAQ